MDDGGSSIAEAELVIPSSDDPGVASTTALRYRVAKHDNAKAVFRQRAYSAGLVEASRHVNLAVSCLGNL